MNSKNHLDEPELEKLPKPKVPRNFEDLTQTEINEYLYQNLPLSVAAVFLLATILFWGLSGPVEKTILEIWYSLVLMVLVFRVMCFVWYQKTKRDTKLQKYYYYYYFILGSILSAVAWGIIGSILMPEDIFSQALIIILVSGIIAGATTSLGTSYLASVSYIILSLLPIMVWLGVKVWTGNIYYLAILLSMVLYLFFSFVTIRKNTKLIFRNIKLNHQNLILLESLKKHLHLIELLSSMEQSLERCYNDQEVATTCKEHLTKILPEFSGGIFLLSHTRLKALEVWGNHFSDTETLEFQKEECGSLTNNSFNISHGEKRCKHCRMSSGFYICMPLRTPMEFYGILHLKLMPNISLQNKEFILAQKALITRIASDISFSLSNIRYQDRLKIEATQDPLTGLFNRRYLEEYFKIELVRFKRKPAPIAIIMLDVDFYKKFNDQYGHKVGDDILREIGMLLKENIRGSDFACRFGGDEFVVILPETDRETALVRAEKIRKGVKNISIIVDDQVITGLTISMGISVFPEQGATQARIIEAADKALYQAKQDGRDRVCIAH